MLCAYVVLGFTIAVSVGSVAFAGPVDGDVAVRHRPDHPSANAGGYILEHSAPVERSDARLGTDLPPAFPGWPHQADENRGRDGAILVQADEDVALEILIYSPTDTRLVHFFNLDGSELPGWPKSVPFGIRPRWGVSFGDVDGDGEGDVVVTSDNGSGSTSGRIYAWHVDGSSVGGFPATIPDEASTTPTVSDLDGDGRAEIIVGQSDYPTGKLHVIGHDGQSRAGWPQTLDNAPAGSSAATFDIDGDGVKEVFVQSYVMLWAFHVDGTVVDGYPVTLPEGERLAYAAITFADVNGDGAVEMAFGTHALDPVRGAVYVTDLAGVPLPGWPIELEYWVYATPTFADLDADGDLEIISGDTIVGGHTNYLFAWHHDGSLVSGWPVGPFDAIDAQVSVGDIDGDGAPELMWSSNAQWADGTGRLYALGAGGAPVRGWPLHTTGSSFFNPVVLGDLDGDGDTEMVVTAGDLLERQVTYYAWDLTNGGSSADIQMPMYQYGPGREGVHPSALAEPPVAVPGHTPPAAGLTVNENPARSRVVFAVDVEGGSRLLILDAGGRLVRSFSLAGAAGQVEWNGRNERGRTVSPGVYWASVIGPDGARLVTRKLILTE